MQSDKPLEELIRELPPDLYDEVREYVERLLRDRQPTANRRLTFSWAGALKGEKKTSVELQHEISRLWSEET